MMIPLTWAFGLHFRLRDSLSKTKLDLASTLGTQLPTTNDQTSKQALAYRVQR